MGALPLCSIAFETWLKTDHVYDAGGRLVVDLLGMLWVGIGGTCFWGDNISGWSIGGDIRLKL